MTYQDPIPQPIDIAQHPAIDQARLRRARGEAYQSRQRVRRLEENPVVAADDPELRRERILSRLFDEVVEVLIGDA